jgi:hypothetical protein
LIRELIKERLCGLCHDLNLTGQASEEKGGKKRDRGIRALPPSSTRDFLGSHFAFCIVRTEIGNERDGIWYP